MWAEIQNSLCDILLNGNRRGINHSRRGGDLRGGHICFERYATLCYFNFYYYDILLVYMEIYLLFIRIKHEILTRNDVVIYVGRMDKSLNGDTVDTVYWP